MQTAKKWYIYKITHPDGKLYVGYTQNPSDRKRRHFGSKCHNIHLKKSIQKLIDTYFQFDIIQECSTKQEALEAEHYWINHLNTLHPNGFNAQP